MRQVRRDLGYTQRELAEMFNTSEGNVSHILTGKSWSEPRPKRQPTGYVQRGMYKTCTWKDGGVRCTRKHRSRGFCHMHYRRARKAGLI